MNSYRVSLALLISLMLSCTKGTNSVSALKSIDEDYYDAAKEYQRAADTLNDGADRLIQAANDADAETRRVEGNIASARSFIQGAESAITTANGERDKADRDRSRYESDEAASNVQAADYIQRTKILMKDLRDVTQQIYVLENKISIKEEQKAALQNFVKSIQEFSEISSKFTSTASDLQSIAKNSEAEHDNWMKQFENLSVQLKPNFIGIVDLDSYRSALTSINEFRSKIPSTGKLRGLEARYAALREDLLLKSQNLRDSGYKLSSSREFSIYLNFVPQSTIAQQMDEIEQVSRDIGNVAREQVKFHDLRNERRQYLSTMVPVAWEKLARVNLQLNNERIGIELIRQVETIISSQYVYNSFQKKMNDVSIDYYNFQRTLFAPRRASLVVSDMLEYLQKIEAPETLNNLSPEMKSQMAAEISDARKVWLSNRSETVSSLNPEKTATFLKEWKRQAKIMGSRLKPSALPDCKMALTQISDANSADASTEQAFVLLKTGC